MSTKTQSLADFQSQIGQVLGTSAWFKITQDQIDQFAKVTHDSQFIHVDPARAAAETPFGGTIAHGYLVLSLLTKQLNEVVPYPSGATVQINYGLNRLRFLNPVLAGSEIRTEITLAKISERRAGQYLFEFEVKTEIQGQEKPALIAKSLALYTF